MNKAQLIILWIGGLTVSAIFCLTGLKLLVHAASAPEMWANGYPLTLIAGTGLELYCARRDCRVIIDI